MAKMDHAQGMVGFQGFSLRVGPILALLGVVLSVGCSTGDVSAPSTSKPAASARSLTALDRYVAAPDTNFSWKLISSTKAEGCTVSVLQMNSQVWLTTNEVDRPLWQHWLTVVRPDSIQSSTGFLFIGGGSSKSGAPKKADDNVMRLALTTKSVVTELRNIPNQPVTFVGESKGMVEDELIAYTWDKYLRTGDEKWPARLPMTKAAVRAMDAITAFCATPEGGSMKVDRYMVAGGSKRGWTTWTTAAVDNRVVAIAPIVIDMLNIVPSFIHHWEVYGFWAPAVGDYVRRGIMDWTGSKEYEALMKIEEPYEYRDRLTMPKFIVNACGDQFFLPDSSQFYFNDLPGVKYLRYVPNTDHSLRGSDAWESVTACHDAILKQAPLPQFSWSRQPDGSIKVQTKDRPLEVKLWQATNPQARDFRLETIGRVWTSTALVDQGGGVYVGSVAKPPMGWTAYMVELTYPSSSPHPFKFTTDVVVNPNTTVHKYVQPKHP
ncbi:MAG: PhoPQ-activated pathogenicity-related family protein [Verrucomicrobiales bacterium]|nr:PhoPQ-activated pathogenicity-related family protein [Verrucomicrobiales bacterium]